MEEDNITHEEDFALARYNTDGTLDSTFDQDGKLTTDFGGDESAFSLAIQDDGKIVVAGRTRDVNFVHDFALARYNIDGSLDSTFDGDGKVTTDFGGGFEEFRSIVIQGDGKIVAAGRTRGLNDDPDFALARYNTNGSLDSTFDRDGKLTTDFGRDEEATSMSLQQDGQIVVTGITGDIFTSNYDFILARYNTDGSLDSTFDQDGKLTTDFGGEETAASLTIQNDGKILVAGTQYGPNTNAVDFMLVRYNTAGLLDSTFDLDGMVKTDFGDFERATSLALQVDGKIVVAGKVYNRNVSNPDFALARYNADGTLDSTFDGDGKLTADFGRDDDLSSSSIFNNRLYVAGTSYSLTYRGLVAAYQLGCNEQVFYKDKDQDGYGTVAQKVLACTAPEGYVSDNTDCNDSNASVHPKAEEICGNNIDDNCNGQVDEGCALLLTINDTTVYESEGVATLRVTLSRKADCPIYVPYFTVDGTARSFSWSKDYRAAWNILTIPAGAQTVTIPIVIYEDNVREPDEYFDVYIFNPLYLAQGYAKGRVSIKDGASNQTTQPLTQVPALEQQLAHEQATGTLRAKASPNPTTHSFTLALQSSSSSSLTLLVRDGSGRLIERRTGVVANTTLKFGSNYRPGAYYAELMQGKERIIVKLVKQAY